MKKFLLAAVLGLSSLVASANNKIQFKNALPADCGATVTVQFKAYQEGSCIFDIASPIYSAPPGVSGSWDLCDDATWFPNILWMPSYETFTATVCITCPGKEPVCLPEIFIDMDPGHACVPNSSASREIPCCNGSIKADVVGGGSGGTCFTLTIR